MIEHKLVQINAALNFSSTGRIVESIGETAIERGWSCYVAHGARYANPTKLNDLHIENRLGESIHAVYSMLFDAQGLGSYWSTKKLTRLLKDIRPDIIHLHNIHGYYLHYPTLFEYVREVQPQLVWTIHDNWAYTGHCVYYEPVGCEKWQSECHDCPRLGTYPKSLFIDRSRNNYQRKKALFTSAEKMTIVPVSDCLVREMSKSFLNKYPLHRIYSGIDTAVFKPIESSLKSELGLQDKFVILGVASGWGQEGRLNGFLKLREILDASYHIVLVGLTPEQISNLPNGIIGLPPTSCREDLAKIYSMADVFMNPTLQDTFGLTSVEAQSCGTPSIVYRTGGAPETVDEKTGVIVEKNDIKALKDAVLTIQATLNRKNDKRFKSLTCRERAVRLFEQKDRFNEYINLYESLI